RWVADTGPPVCGSGGVSCGSGIKPMLLFPEEFEGRAPGVSRLRRGRRTRALAPVRRRGEELLAHDLLVRLAIVDRARAAADQAADERALAAADQRADAGAPEGRAPDDLGAVLLRALVHVVPGCGRPVA